MPLSRAKPGNLASRCMKYASGVECTLYVVYHYECSVISYNYPVVLQIFRLAVTTSTLSHQLRVQPWSKRRLFPLERDSYTWGIRWGIRRGRRISRRSYPRCIRRCVTDFSFTFASGTSARRNATLCRAELWQSSARSISVTMRSLRTNCSTPS